MNDLWSNQLVKKSISEFLTDELEEHLPEKELESTRNQLSIFVESKEDLEKLRTSIAALEDKVDEGFFDCLMEDFSDIEEDYHWKSTGKGKEVMELNDWAQQFYQEFRLNEAYEDVLIGGHESKNVVFVAGSVKTQAVLDELIEYVSSKSPPLEVLWSVKVNT